MNLIKAHSLSFKEVERNQLVVIDLTTLKNVISITIKDLLESFGSLSISNQMPDPQDKEELLNMEEVLKFLKVSKVTIHNWKKKGIIKSHRIGRKLYFKRGELMNAIKHQKYSVIV
jgi:predicted DNA-binding transcriptional regulator AlpA